jgi:hypothetical protein
MTIINEQGWSFFPTNPTRLVPQRLLQLSGRIAFIHMRLRLPSCHGQTISFEEEGSSTPS